jgi:hypothetical protein
MNTILLAWQLGAGTGHVMRMRPFAELGRDTSHRVYAVFRHLTRAAPAFAKVPVNFLQAPAKAEGNLCFRRPTHFAHLLANTGFGRRGELFVLASAWRNLFRLTSPDLILFDHSPIALLASRGLSASDGRPLRRIVTGNGFTVPPGVTPMPPARSLRGINVDTAQVAEDENRILCGANWLLRLWKQPPLTRLSELYADVDETFLTTFPELDHFPNRAAGCGFVGSSAHTASNAPQPPYWGPINDNSGGAPPQWPAGNTLRIFAYLKRSPLLSDLLRSLRDRRLPTLIYPDGIPGKIKSQFQSDTLNFASDRVDPAAAARECDFAILNATPSTTCDVLLAGKAILHLPIYGEHELMAEACERLGVSQTLWSKTATRDHIGQTLDKFLANLPQHIKAAQAFAARYAHFDPQAQREKMLARTLELLNAGVSKGTAAALESGEFALNYP